MLLDHELSRDIAEGQSLRGLELAFAANDAYIGYRVEVLGREAILAQSRDLEPRDYGLMLGRTTPVVTASTLKFEELSNAAGALIGYNTLGGDYISVQSGRQPQLQNDGSYQTG